MIKKLSATIGSVVALSGALLLGGAGTAQADMVCYNNWTAADGHSAGITCNYANGRPYYYFTMRACSAGGCTTVGSRTVPVGQPTSVSTAGYLAGDKTIYAVW